MRFIYQAKDTNGSLKSGELNCDSQEAATMQLRQQGLYVVSLEEAAESSAKQGPSIFAKPVTRRDIVEFASQLAVMVDAGVPISSALEGLAGQTDNPSMKTLTNRLQESVQAGEDLSIALSKYPKHFDKAFVNLVKASEASGQLGPMLDRIATQYRTEAETRSKIKGALIYPAAMVTMCVGVVIFLLTYVFPKLMPMFAGREKDIPGPTKALLAISQSMTTYWPWYLGVTVVLLAVGIYMARQASGRIMLDWLKIYLPPFNGLSRKVALSRSLRTLSTTLNAGVPMLEALELSGGTANNHFYESCWKQVSEQVTTGRQIHEALQGQSLFPKMVVQMIASGEKTGRLGKVLEKVAEYLEREVANAVKTVTSLLEPLIITVLGSAIGGIAIAMLLPIFKLSSPVR
ncbi:MAG: type II secretion system F family protein [Planctomycetaceae bacterium]|nr:type II secretion system F family protein [Planctomycetaceae bacterium]